MEKFTKALLVTTSLVLTFSAFAGHGWKRVNYTNSTIFTGVVTVNGQPAQNGDVIGIFVKGECRMIATVFTQNDSAFVSAVLHGEKVDSATIKYWSSAEDKIYDVDDTIITNPAGEIQRYPINLKSSATSSCIVKSSDIKIYPSSAKSDIFVSTSKDIKNIIIINNIGLKVIDQDDVKQVNVASLPKGIYFVSVTTSDGQTITRKIVKN